jgi:hypothetical protein
MLVLDIAIERRPPSIQADLPCRRTAMVISAHAPVFGGFPLLGGRAADIMGRRRLLSAVRVFTVAS